MTREACVAKCKTTGRDVRSRGLTDVPDSCYRRDGFSLYDPRRCVYGDQGQEVAWEVGQERFVAKRW